MTQPEMNHKKAVELLIRIARLDDPASLRLGDHLNLIEDLRSFLDLSGKGGLARQLNRAQRKPGILKRAMIAVRELVDAAANGKRKELSFGPGKVVLDGSKLGGRDALLWDGDLRDVIAQFAAIDLAELEPGEVGRCAACRQPFLVARKGQRYCGHACAVKVAVRVYQKRHRAERAQRERERRQRKKLNRAVTAREGPNGEATR